VLAPGYLAETRALTRNEALLELKARCLDLVPPPRPDWATDAAADEWARRTTA
jgi:hypothetical protein